VHPVNSGSNRNAVFQQKTKLPRGGWIKRRSSLPTLNIRLTDAQAERLSREAEEFGLTMGSIVKARTFGDDYTPRRSVRPDRQELARIAGQLGKIGGNLNQVTRAINSGRLAPNAEIAKGLVGAQDSIEEMKKALRSALGMRPEF
jgi:hypothetical protein